jgi:hypothetical protein
MTYHQKDIELQQMQDYNFLTEMYRDPYFPNHVVDMGKSVLVKLCLDIENQQPENLEELYKLTHATTEEFNDLETVFYDNGSEIETAARECICENLYNIAVAYDFKDANSEDLAATRDW